MQRTAFFISDSTGITAETLGRALLAQFDGIVFEYVTLPYVDSEEKALQAVKAIDTAAQLDSAAPIIFDTVVNQDIRNIIAKSEGFILDVFATFLSPLEEALQTPSNFAVGRASIQSRQDYYSSRIDAVHFALYNDDGARTEHYNEAEVILVGVSRSGKTPTCVYLAMQAGVFAANYPLTEDDLETNQMPAPLQAHRRKLFGLTIHPERLSAIRNERKADSRYASIQRCEDEVRMAESLFARYRIPYVDTTEISIEEIATKLMLQMGLRSRLR